MSIFNELGKYVVESDDDTIQLDDIDISDIMQQGLSYKNNFTEDDADPEELKMGLSVEMEHTNNKAISKKIALDHLSEIPDYYTRLRKMEEEAGRNVEEWFDGDQIN